MFYSLSEDIISIIILYLDSYIIHNFVFIKNKLINLDLLILKRTNKYLYDIIDKYYLKKYNYKNIYVINDTITDYYI